MDPPAITYPFSEGKQSSTNHTKRKFSKKAKKRGQNFDFLPEGGEGRVSLRHHEPQDRPSEEEADGSTSLRR